MKKVLTIKNSAVQYGLLGQLHTKDIILEIDELSIRGDVALTYLKHGMNLADKGKCDDCDFCRSK